MTSGVPGSGPNSTKIQPGTVRCGIKGCINLATLCPVLVFPRPDNNGVFRPIISNDDKRNSNRASVAVPFCLSCSKELTLKQFFTPECIEYFREWHGKRGIPFPPVSLVVLDWEEQHKIMPPKDARIEKPQASSKIWTP